MGLLSAFGVGGGKLSIEPASSQVQAGGTLTGKVVFTSGKRAQNITNIKITLNCNVTSMVPTPQGPQQRTNSSAIVPQTQVTGAFASVPGQRHEFPFTLQIPSGVQNTMPNVVAYRLGASADIDGEVDPGANIEIGVTGGSAAAMSGQMGMPGAMGAMGAMPGAMGAMPGAMGAMPGAMGAMPGAMGAMPGQFVVGQQVVAQWQDGQWHPGTVVAMQNGMIGVDWTDPQLGASSWVQPQQVQHANQMGMGGGMPPMQPMQQQQQLMVGSHVMAQWQDGQWHPGTVVAMQNGMIGVDWTEPQLGASSWLQPQQVTAQQQGMGGMMSKDAPKGGFGGGFGGDSKHDPKGGFGGGFGHDAKHDPKGGFAGGFGGDVKHDQKSGFGGGFGGDVKQDPYAQKGFGDVKQDPYAQQQKGFGDVKQDPYAQQGGFGAKPDPYAQQGDFGAKQDPYAQQGGFGAKQDPYAQQGGFGTKQDPYAQQKGGFGGGDPYAQQKGGVMVGSHVFAQWQDGNWYPAKVVALQNGMIGVDWDDPNLGASSWVQSHQIQAK